MGVEAAFVFPHPPIVVPAVGRGEEDAARLTIESCRKAAADLVAMQPDCIVLSSPHAYIVPDGFYITTAAELTGSMSRFHALHTNIDVSVATDLVNEIIEKGSKAGIRFMGSGPQDPESFDHGTYVPLYFVAEAYAQKEGIDTSGGLPDHYRIPVPVVRLGMSQLPDEEHIELGRCVHAATEYLGLRVAYLASGDCAHRLSEDGPYGFHPDALVLENNVIEALSTGDLSVLMGQDKRMLNNAGDCGTRSFLMMAGALSGRTFESTLLSEESPFGIGYCVAELIICEEA